MNEIKNHIDSINHKYKKNGISNPNYKLNEINLPARILFLGPSNSGKTNLMYEFLKRTNGSFTELHLCVKNPDQSIYDDLKRRLKDQCFIYEVGEIPDLDNFDNTDSKLIIFDDYVNDKNAQKKITDYYIRGRHKKFTIIMLSQTFFEILKPTRINADYICILKLNSLSDLKLILRTFPILKDFKEVCNIYEYSTKKKGDFMMVDIPNNKLRHNFLEYLT